LQDESLTWSRLFNFPVKQTIILMGIELFLDTILFSALDNV